MAKPPMKPAGDTASDADWQIASQRELALKVESVQSCGVGLVSWDEMDNQVGG